MNSFTRLQSQTKGSSLKSKVQKSITINEEKTSFVFCIYKLAAETIKLIVLVIQVFLPVFVMKIPGFSKFLELIFQSFERQPLASLPMSKLCLCVFATVARTVSDKTGFSQFSSFVLIILENFFWCMVAP